MNLLSVRLAVITLIFDTTAIYIYLTCLLLKYFVIGVQLKPGGVERIHLEE